MKNSPPGAGYLNAVRADGVAFPAVLDSASTPGLITLASSTTYYIPFGGVDAPTPTEVVNVDVQLSWDNAITFVATVETTNFPRFRNGARDGVVDIADHDATAGNWLPQNPAGATVAIVNGVASGLQVTVTAGGGTGGVDYNLGNFGPRRGRIKIVVGAAGGTIRANAVGKLG